MRERHTADVSGFMPSLRLLPTGTQFGSIIPPPATAAALAWLLFFAGIPCVRLLGRIFLSPRILPSTSVGDVVNIPLECERSRENIPDREQAFASSVREGFDYESI